MKSARMVGTGRCKILYGPKGTGKTTILKVFFTLCSILADHTIPLYYSYDCEEIISPLELLHEMNGDESISKINESKMVILLMDEVQELYFKSDLARSKAIVDELAVIGKSEWNIGILAGSSLNTAQYCLYPERYGWTDFKGLNPTVYTPSKIEPVRDKATFRSLVEWVTKQPLLPTDELLLFKSFNVTGGLLGRLLEGDLSIPPLPEVYWRDFAVRQIIDEMYLSARNHIRSESFDSFTHPPSISLSRAHLIISRQNGGREAIQRKLTEYVDSSNSSSSGSSSSVFYVRNDRVELLLPIHLWSVHQQTAGWERFESMALEGLLTGWSEAVGTMDGSVGHAVENLLMKQAIRKKYFRTLPDDIQLEFDSNHLEINSTSKIAAGDIDRQLRKAKRNFNGLDGFAVVRRSPSLVEIFALQIQTGRLDSSISRVQLTTYLRRAKEGLETLIGMLKVPRRCFRSTKIAVREFLLVTTKAISTEDQLWFREAGRMGELEGVAMTVCDQQTVVHDLQDLGLRDRIKNWMSW